jgi:hypothetical protein
MIHPTAATRLVAPAGGALGLTPGLPRTAAGTVNLATVAAAADEYLRLASERTGTAGPALPPPPPGRGMDAVCNGWSNAPACVLGTVWGAASNPGLAV